MDREELIAFLKQNLSICCEEDQGRYGEPDSIKIKISLGDEEITSDYFNFPRND